MATPADTSQRHRAQLAELAALGMALAADIQAEALCAESPEQKAELAGAFHRVARTVRQSIALEARLERDEARAAREAARAAAEAEREALARRKAQVRARVRGMVWSEHEAEDCQALIEELDDRLSDAEHLPGFEAASVDELIARLRGELGLEPGVPGGRRRAARPPGPAGPVEIKVRFVDPSPELACDLDEGGVWAPDTS